VPIYATLDAIDENQFVEIVVKKNTKIYKKEKRSHAIHKQIGRIQSCPRHTHKLSLNPDAGIQYRFNIYIVCLYIYFNLNGSLEIQISAKRDMASEQTAQSNQSPLAQQNAK